MTYTFTDGIYILKISRGEWVHKAITHFCEEKHIKNAVLTGIGAVSFLRCGYYDLPQRSYRFTEYTDTVEVASYTGNVMQKEDGLFIHAHGVFSNESNETFGGHIDEMQVGVVFEVILTPLSSSLRRTFDEETGLYLIEI